MCVETSEEWLLKRGTSLTAAERMKEQTVNVRNWSDLFMHDRRMHKPSCATYAILGEDGLSTRCVIVAL